MRDYELTVLVRSDDVKSLKDLLTKSGAKIKAKKDPEKRTLAYEINKVQEAFYVFFDLEVDPADVPGLDSKLKQEENVMRYLLVKKGD